MNDAKSGLPAGAGSFYAEVAAMVSRGESGAVATVIETDHSSPRHAGSKMLVRADGGLVGSVGGGSAEARTVEMAQLVMGDGICRRLKIDLTGDEAACGGSMEIFIEPLDTSTPLWIIGGGHVGRALCETAARLSLRVTTVDDRPEFLADLPAGTGQRLDAVKLAGHFRPTPQTAVVVATRNHTLDGDYVGAILRAEREAGVRVGYLGVVGSRRKAEVLRRRLEAEAPDEEAKQRLDDIRVPVGLAIGAETPAEIAVSIAAEILAEIRDTSAGWITDDDGRRSGVLREQWRKR